MLNAAAVSVLLGISRRSVYDLAASGHLPSYRLGPAGGALRFDPADVEEYRQACRSTATTETAVRSILSDGRPARVIAHQYGVDRSTVSHIKSGKIWRHVSRKTG